MDFEPDSLLNERNSFYRGAFKEVIDALQGKSEGQLLRLRAQLELDPSGTVSGLRPRNDAEKAVNALGLHKIGKIEEAMALVSEIDSDHSPDVRVIVAMVHVREGLYEQALNLLSTLTESLEAVALTIQIHLACNQLQQAQTTLDAAKKWAQDAELIQLAEAWVHVRAGGEQYQSAFYTFQELADATGGTSTRMLLAQAVTEIEMGNYNEAAVTLKSVLSKDPKEADALANSIALDALLRKDGSTHHQTLKRLQPDHPLIVDLEEKSNLFDECARNYTYVKA